jgi:hypothetical protein
MCSCVYPCPIRALGAQSTRSVRLFPLPSASGKAVLSIPLSAKCKRNAHFLDSWRSFRLTIFLDYHQVRHQVRGARTFIVPTTSAEKSTYVRLLLVS